MALIKVQDVQLETVNKGRNVYQIANVIYTNDRDERKEKKVVSFGNPAVFEVLKNAVAGQAFEVTYTPGDKYYNWASATPSNGDFTVTPGPTQRAAAAPTTGFRNTVNDPRETKEERDENRTRIVRQSSIGYAIAMLTPGAKAPLDLGNVIGLAEDIYEWVYDKGIDSTEGTFTPTA